MSATVALTRALGPLRDGVAGAGGMVAYAIDPAHRRCAARNHRRLFPLIDEREARRRARASFRWYARLVGDFIWACGADDTAVMADSVVIGMEHVEAVVARGAVVVTIHHGNWDMALRMAGVKGLAVSTVMAPFGPPAVTDLLVSLRGRDRLQVFTAERAARGLMRALRRGETVALLCDMPDTGPRTVVDFCGGPVAFSTVPARLARQADVSVLPAMCRRGGVGEPRFVATAYPPIEVAGRSEEEVMQAVADVFTPAVRSCPEQWYPFGPVYADWSDRDHPALSSGRGRAPDR